MCWFIPQRPQWLRLDQAKNRSLVFCHGQQESKYLGHLLLPAYVHQQGSGSEREQAGIKLMSVWDAGIVSGSLVHCATVPDQKMCFECYQFLGFEWLIAQVYINIPIVIAQCLSLLGLQNPGESYHSPTSITLPLTLLEWAATSPRLLGPLSFFLMANDPADVSQRFVVAGRLISWLMGC